MDGSLVVKVLSNLSLKLKNLLNLGDEKSIFILQDVNLPVNNF